jgi:RNA-directed DNA polymerase
MRAWLRYHPEVQPKEVIAYLNTRLLGWANYYRHAVSKAIFAYVDHHVFSALWKWCCRRHSNKNKYWTANKYFGVDKYGSWCFHAFAKNLNGDIRKIRLRQTQDTPITRHIKVKGKVSMDDPTLISYWKLRAERLLERKATPGKRVPLRAVEA